MMLTHSYFRKKSTLKAFKNGHLRLRLIPDTMMRFMFWMAFGDIFVFVRI